MNPLAALLFQVGRGTEAVARDSDGVEFATAEDASLDAAVALARMMSDAISQPVAQTMFIEICDDGRQPIARLTLSLKLDRR
jgi:hypothetical protein